MGAATKLRAEAPPPRSPEREALAEAIATLAERRAALARAEAALAGNGWEARSEAYRRKSEAEQALAELPKARAAYAEARAYGEEATPPQSETALRAVIEEAEREIAESQEIAEAQKRVASSLREMMFIPEGNVRNAAVEVMRRAPAIEAILDARDRAWAQYQYLDAMVRPLHRNGGGLLVDERMPQFTVGRPACPFAEAQEALLLSADAPVPTLPEALARFATVLPSAG